MNAFIALYTHESCLCCLCFTCLLLLSVTSLPTLSTNYKLYKSVLCTLFLVGAHLACLDSQSECRICFLLPMDNVIRLFNDPLLLKSALPKKFWNREKGQTITYNSNPVPFIWLIIACNSTYCTAVYISSIFIFLTTRAYRAGQLSMRLWQPVQVRPFLLSACVWRWKVQRC